MKLLQQRPLLCDFLLVFFIFYSFLIFRVFFMDSNAILSIEVSPGIMTIISPYFVPSQTFLYYFAMIYLILPILVLLYIIVFHPRWVVLTFAIAVIIYMYLWVCFEGYTNIVDLGLIKMHMFCPWPTGWDILVWEFRMIKADILSIRVYHVVILICLALIMLILVAYFYDRYK